MDNILESFLLLPIYGLLGYLISRLARGSINLPWYLTEKQFYGLSFSAFVLAAGWYSVRLLQIYFITKRPPADSLVGLAELSVWFIGYMLPFYIYRQQQLKDSAYVQTLKEKQSLAHGWELPPGLIEHLKEKKDQLT